jgi:hypothetical protein
MTPLQKAFKKYSDNKYYVAQLIALFMLTYGIITIDEFDSILGIIVIFTICGSVLLVPFIFMFSWYRQYKKNDK